MQFCFALTKASIGSSTTDIMSPPINLEDPEDPASSRVKCRCLDYFLVISLVLLTILVGSLCILYVAWERPLLKSTFITEIENHQEGRSAQLLVDTHVIRNGTMEWSDHAVTNTFVGKYIQRDKEELIVEKSGFYFISSQIMLMCDYSQQCESDGAVSITIVKKGEQEPILEVNVAIKNPATKNKISSFSGSISFLSSGDRISAEIQTSRKITYWTFVREHSVLSLFWISGKVRHRQELVTSQGQK